jgi:phosphoribosylanthranilate isomerase
VHEIDPVMALDGDPDLAPTAFWLPQLHIDAYHPELAGGTGHTGDWALAAHIAAGVPRLMLAGGLTPDNVADAIQAVRPWAVDVSSGVEHLPGLKNHDKIRAFVTAVREVDERLTS